MMYSCSEYKQKGLYYDERAAVQAKNGKWGFVDRNMNEVIPCVYEKVWWFSNGYAEVKKGEGKCGIIDTNGNEIVPCQYEAISIKDAFDHLPVEVKINGKYGMITLNGIELIPVKYDYLDFMNKGIIRARLGQEYVIYDKLGNELFFKKGLMRIEDIDIENHTFKLIDIEDGNELTYQTIVMSIKKKSDKLLSPRDKKEIVKTKCTRAIINRGETTDMVRFVITPGAHSLADDVEYKAYSINTKLLYEIVADELTIFVDEGYDRESIVSPNDQ